MSKKTPDKSMDSFSNTRWVECYVDTAINPVTKNQVTLTPPVRIGCYEDFAKFYDQWEDFCEKVLPPLDPDEVCFTLT
jgi:hypothetical protein